MDKEIKIMAEPKDPETCKFTVDQPVFPDGSFYFQEPETAKESPLAETILEIEGVRAVLVHHNMVTVYTTGTLDWYPAATEIGTRIRKVLASEKAPISPKILETLPSEEELRGQVKNLLEKEINPALAQHGGSVNLIDVKGNEVYIQLNGGCVGCGMVEVTLKHGIERAIREVIPAVGAILDTTDHAAGQNPYYAPPR
jgi:Fe-S cluster biogenesis protein NfuA